MEASRVVRGAEVGGSPDVRQAHAPLPLLSVLLRAVGQPGSVPLRQLLQDFQVLLGKKQRK